MDLIKSESEVLSQLARAIISSLRRLRAGFDRNKSSDFIFVPFLLSYSFVITVIIANNPMPVYSCLMRKSS